MPDRKIAESGQSPPANGPPGSDGQVPVLATGEVVEVSAREPCKTVVEFLP
ncbi:hypothetical protein RGQ15_20735 [Paracoccus sp. MBLB3053]|uniref:Uncharacterized protein n=1 Tax=Paracoccus aurantius TaxID=3073814 RepID=A0ABU2HZM4_9RHOB|nr:hypothetical protein [Paracoccus sp. MBLB3053]MDS9469980.1 hypothetical protein [Paracoccus sp. MBLB3053]